MYFHTKSLKRHNFVSTLSLIYDLYRDFHEITAMFYADLQRNVVFIVQTIFFVSQYNIYHFFNKLEFYIQKKNNLKDFLETYKDHKSMK